MGFLGTETEQTDKNTFVTRASFTGYLARLAAYPVTEHTTADIPFNDVNITTPYCNEICTMFELDIVSGTDPNKFSPDAYITYAQACKLICDVLGYRDYARVKYGEYPEGYVMMASELDIDDGVNNVSYNGSLTADNAVKMLYNACFAEIMTLSGFDKNGNPTYSTEGKTLLSKNDIYYGKGTLQCDGVASIYSKNVLENIAVIDNVNYEIENADLTDLLGLSIEYFYRDKDNVKTVLAAWENERFNNSIVLRATDLATSSSDFTRTCVVYYKSNGDTKKLNLDDVSNVVYNNEFMPIAEVDTLKINSGKMRLIDNDDDDDVYDVVIIEEFKNAFVQGNPTDSNAIIDKYSNSLNLDDYDNVKIYMGGKEIQKSEIPANTVISYIDNSDSITIYVTNNYRKGKISNLKTKHGNKIYTIEDEEFKLAQSYIDVMNGNQNFVDIKVGSNYKIWLDIDGEIAEIQEGDGNLQYALLVEAVRDNPEGIDNVYIRLIFTDGTDNRAIITKNVVFNDKKISVSELFNDGVADYNSRNNYSKLFDEDGELKQQVIKVSFRDDGTVREIQTAVDNTEHPYGYDAKHFSFDIDGSKTVTYTNSLRTIDTKWILESSTIVFVQKTGADMPDSWEIASGTTAYQSGGYYIQAWDVSPNLVPTIMYKSSSPRDQSWIEYFCIVEDIEEVWVDDEELKKVYVYLDGAHSSYTELSPGILPDTVKKGDVIKIAQWNNRLTGVKSVINLDTVSDSFISGELNGDEGLLFSTIYSVSDTGLTVLTPTGYEATYNGSPIMSIGITQAKIPITVYNRDSEEIIKSDFTAIKQIVLPNADGTLPERDDLVKVLIRCESMRIVELIIIQ